jgi:hypothetical protein
MIELTKEIEMKKYSMIHTVGFGEIRCYGPEVVVMEDMQYQTEFETRPYYRVHYKVFGKKWQHIDVIDYLAGASVDYIAPWLPSSDELSSVYVEYIGGKD